MLRIWHRKNIYYYLGYSIIVMDSSSKFFFSFSVNYAMIVKLVDLIVLLGSKLLNRFRKFSTIFPTIKVKNVLIRILHELIVEKKC